MSKMIQDAIKQVKEAAEKELAFCDSIDTPYVCLMISSSEGREKVLNQIVELVGSMGCSISDAIFQIENESNPNAAY